MRKVIDTVLIAGFLLVDFLLFHDLFKAGEQFTTVEYMVGILSLIVFFNSAQSLLKNSA